MKAFVSFLVGVLVGVAGHWFFTQGRSQPIVASTEESVKNAGQSLKDTFDTEKIKDELSRTGQVIREKARQAGSAISDAAANARTTTTIKAKLLKEPNISSLKIDVDTTDGVVTLSGKVASHDQIARAMSLALETEGVHKVVSSLQVDSK